MGECLNDLSYDQLGNLSEEVDNSLKAIRERKVGSFFLSSLFLHIIYGFKPFCLWALL